jgi:ADP-ribose pyrophosphatase YjhB (NUDIX family)
VLGVQNHYGSWSAVKGHLKITDDMTLETPYETSERELFEELSIDFESDNRIIRITKENIGLLALNKTNFIQYHVDTRPDTNDRSRLIGLFFVRVDEKKWKFTLKDTKENMVIINLCFTLKNKLKYENGYFRSVLGLPMVKDG